MVVAWTRPKSSHAVCGWQANVVLTVSTPVVFGGISRSDNFLTTEDAAVLVAHFTAGQETKRRVCAFVIGNRHGSKVSFVNDSSVESDFKS